MKVDIEHFDDPIMIKVITEGLPEDKKLTMSDCLKHSNSVWFGLIDSKIACVWGIALPTVLSIEAYLWLWTSEIVKEHPFVFIRRAQIVVKDLLKEYEAVVGVVDTHEANAANSIRWLKHLGAKFSEPTIGGLMPFKIKGIEHG